MGDQIDNDKLKQIVEASLLAADEPLTVDRLARLFANGELDSEAGRGQLRDVLDQLTAEAEGRGYELQRVASGYRYQVRQELAPWVSRLWEEKPPRYTRALLETLALIAYRQPVTRGDIEQVRGVTVSPNIMRVLLERGWIRVVGQREVPGKPNLYGTTRSFLDYFNLKSLDQLPPLTEIRSLIEPLVLEEVAEEARLIAEHDHPELADDLSDAEQESSADAGTQQTRVEDIHVEAIDLGTQPARQDAVEDGDREVEDADREVEGAERDLAEVDQDEEVVQSEEAGWIEDDELDRVRVAVEDAEAEVEDDARRDESEDEGDGVRTHSAEVVRLPTAPRR